MLLRSGTREIAQLNQRELGQLKNLLKDNLPFELLSKAVTLRLPRLDEETKEMYQRNGKWVNLAKLSSKEIRLTRSDETPLCAFKCGLLLEPLECSGWLKIVNSLTSTAHKNAILRYIHGDIYSKARQFRFGLSDNPHCETCGQTETINHRIYECDYAMNLWRAVANLTSNTNPLDQNFVVGAFENCTKAKLTIHAEVITKLIKNSRVNHLSETEYLRNLVRGLAKKEKGTVKSELENFI